MFKVDIHWLPLCEKSKKFLKMFELSCTCGTTGSHQGKEIGMHDQAMVWVSLTSPEVCPLALTGNGEQS